MPKKAQKSKGTKTKTLTRSKPAATRKKTSKKQALRPAAKKAKSKVSKVSTAPTYKGVAIGAAVPSFEVAATSGRRVSAKDFNGKITILYFYPKDNTPGCTLEGHDFKAHASEMQRLGAQVFGVSRDSLKAHENFKAKCGFPFDLLSDDSDRLGKIFDVIQMKKLYGRVFEGIERSTFVIDASGRLQREWRRVRVAGHAAEVLDFIRSGMKE
jgi:peroxiredoxin Q/BCP